MNAVKALLFDLGGVVINIDFDRVLKHWATISALSFAELKSTFHFDIAYQRHERGELDAAEYFDHLRKTLALKGSDDEIAAGWNASFVAEIPTVLEAINQVRSLRPCYAFTNTNPTHCMDTTTINPPDTIISWKVSYQTTITRKE